MHLPQSVKTALLRFVTRKSMPIPVADESALFRRAASYLEMRAGKVALDRDSMRSLAREYGADFAATVFYLAVSRAKGNQEFFERVRARVNDVFSDPRVDGTFARTHSLWMIPAALYHQYPEFGADGGLLAMIFKRQAIESQILPIANLGSVPECANQIAEALRNAEAPVVIVSLSKGSADLRVALDREPALSKKIVAWISISGLYRGSYLLDKMAAARGLKRALIRLNCWMHGGHISFAKTLGMLPPSPLASVPSIERYPFPVLSIVSVPLRSHLSRYALGRSKYLDAWGPHDGTTLLCDAIIPGSVVYPVWGADHHYLRAGSIREVELAILSFLGAK